MRDRAREWASQVRVHLRRSLRRIALRATQTPAADLAALVAAKTSPAQGQYLRIRISEIRNRNSDHTFLWRQASQAFPGKPEYLRRLIHAALREGRISDATDALETLAARGQMRSGDARFIIGLSFVDHALGNDAHVRKRLKWFLHALRGGPDYRLGGLRLSRMILAYFARQQHRSAIHAFPGMLSRSAIPPRSGALLQRVYACEQALMAEAPLSLFDTDISAEQNRRFVELVRVRLREREPFSFVRVGDGEAACLPYEPGLATLAHGDRRDRERIWWGKPLPASLSAALKKNVREAIWQADSIGLPTLGRFLRELNLPRNDALENGLTGRGLRAILNAAEHYRDFRPHTLPPPVFTSCHLHQDLQRWKLYDELLDGAGEIVLVSCHPELPDWMSRKFGVTVVANIVLPPDKVSAPKLGNSSLEPRPLPYIMDKIVAELADSPRGRLVLVGGGYPGKWLVHEAKKRGGIALDVGSIFDYWLGLTTRSYLDLSPVDVRSAAD